MRIDALPVLRKISPRELLSSLGEEGIDCVDYSLLVFFIFFSPLVRYWSCCEIPRFQGFQPVLGGLATVILSPEGGLFNHRECLAIIMVFDWFIALTLLVCSGAASEDMRTVRFTTMIIYTVQ